MADISSLLIGSSSIGDLVHIVIDNVKTNTGTGSNDASMNDKTTIYIGSGSSSNVRGIWTSTIEPQESRVELDCEVVKTSDVAGIGGSIVTARCYSDTDWPDSVFNRLPINIVSMISSITFGPGSYTNVVLLGTNQFRFYIYGSVPSGWSRYNVTGSGSSLTINNQLTITDLPESFVSHWVNMGAKAYMGGDRAMLVPPDS